MATYARNVAQHRPGAGPGAGPGGHDVSALEYEMARLPRDVTTAVTWYMDENDVSQRQLADNMGLTPGRVSQILSGDENLTLRTLAAVCVGLGAHFQVDLVSNQVAEGDPSFTALRREQELLEVRRRDLERLVERRRRSYSR